MRFEIKKGLDLPITGEPQQTIEAAKPITSVAIIGPDYIGMKPTMLVREGESVKTGQPVFEDKKNPGVFFTAPGTGKISAINRGAKRALQSVVIELEGDEQETFQSFDDTELLKLDGEQVEQNLIDSGLWTALRTRPYSRIPARGTRPNSIFVTAIDTNPLAADPSVVIAEHQQDFGRGLTVLGKLTEGKVHVCKAEGTTLTLPNGGQVQASEFTGKHPAGNVGTHIHFLDPVGAGKSVWHLNYQDCIAIGKLFNTGNLWLERVISIGGPIASNPRLVRTRLGANLSEIADGEVTCKDCRLISGSVWNGRRANGWAGFLGRYHLQLSMLAEGRDRAFMGWAAPGVNKFSSIRVFVSQFTKGKKFDLTTTQNGSPRAMVPIGNYEGIMPLDILPTQLLRALLVKDTDSAQALGCLELDEEDLALSSFVCVGKYDFGPVLRSNLEQIEREG